MKTLSFLFCFVLLFIANQNYAQDASVPSKVKAAFDQKFPNVSDLEWAKENDAEWEAEFKLNGKEYSANFSTNGIWKETEYEIEDNALPRSIKNTLNSKFNGYTIKQVEVAETPDGNFYEVEIEKGENKIEVLLDKSGKIIKQKNESDDDDND